MEFVALVIIVAALTGGAVASGRAVRALLGGAAIGLAVVVAFVLFVIHMASLDAADQRMRESWTWKRASPADGATCAALDLDGSYRYWYPRSAGNSLICRAADAPPLGAHYHD